jgi:hypothetical protein
MLHRARARARSPDLTAAEAARQIRAGALSPTAYLNARLARIGSWKPEA